MNFNDSKKDTHKPETATYKASVSGYYSVSSKTYIAKPTGIFETVKDDDRQFWEFWKPKFVTIEKYEQIEIHTGFQVKYLVEGEEVDSAFAPQRLGN